MHFNKILKRTIFWKLLNTVFVFIVNLLMVRLLTVSISGTFFYDIAILSFLVLVLSWSLESGITYYAVRNISIVYSIIKILFPLLILQSLLCWMVVYKLNLSISNFLSVVFIAGNLCTIYFSAIFYAKKWFVLLNIISGAVNFLIIIFLIFCYFFLSVNTVSQYYCIVAYISGIGLQALIMILILMFKPNKIEVNSGVSSQLISKIFAYSSVAFISNIVFFLVMRIDYFFVEKYCSLVALSNYVQVSKMGQLLILIPSIIASMVFPYSADKNQGISLQRVQQLCKLISLIFIAVTLLFILTGFWVLPFMFGKDFSFMYMAMLLYIPGFFALSIITVLAAFLAGEKHLNTNLVSSVLALIIVISGDVLLIPLFGINAAAAVSSVAYIACGCYILYFYQLKYKCKPISFFYINKPEILYVWKQLIKIIPINKKQIIEN